MKITKEWLDLNNACEDCKKLIIENYPDLEVLILIEKLIESKKLKCANWLKEFKKK